jgi:predicted nucleic acid-binding protein
MTSFILDANVVISILISGRATNKTILRGHDYLSPDFLLAEINQYQAEISKKSKLDKAQLRFYTKSVFEELTILPNYVIEEKSLKSALALLEEIDLKDVQYLALSIQLDLPLLTRDKPLYKGLKKQGYRKVQLWEDFLKTL